MRQRIVLALISLLLIVAPLGIVAASDVSGALYKIIITVGNTSGSTTYTNSSTVFTLPSGSMISGGYANSSFSNIAIQNSTGADVAFMPGWPANPWVLHVPTIAPSSYIQNVLYTATSTGGKLRYFPDTNAGLTVADNATIELGTNYDILIDGYFKTTTASVVIQKTNAATFLLSTTGTGFRVQSGAGATDISYDCASGDYAIRVSNDGANTTLYVDASGVWPTTARGTDADAVGIADTADAWEICKGVAAGSCVYMKYAQFGNPSGTPLCYWDWEYAATFTDNISSVVATPVFRTTALDALVTASAGDFVVIDPAEATATALATPTDWYNTPTISGTFTTGNVTPTFPGASIITAIAAATSTPNNLPLTIITGVVILILSLAVSALMRRGGSGSLIIKMVLIGGLLGVAVATQIFDLWMPLVFLLLAAAVAMGSQQRGWN